MENVMEMVHGPWAGEVFGKMGGVLHESPEGVKRGFESAVPLSMVGLAQRASTHDGAQELLATLKGGHYPHLDASDLGRVAADPDSAARVAQSSEGLLSRLFGNKQSGVVDGLASSAGVSASSASKLLGLALPVVLGFVGKQTASRNFDESGLRGFLASQRKVAGDALPGPLSNLFGGHAETPAVVADRPVAHTPAPIRRPRGSKWLLLPLAAVAVLVLLLARRGGRHEMPVIQGTPRTQMIATSRPQALHAGSMATLTQALSSGETLPQRFVLSDLRFRTDSAHIDQSSAGVLDELAKVMAAYPNAKIRVEGHTDNTGTRETNQELSQARAEATRTYLVDKGIGGDRIEAVGSGQDRPLVSNDQASGRAENRRTEVVVLSR
jgi:outer membrane protein OmpA-like peptidoglycan-associated protein